MFSDPWQPSGRSTWPDAGNAEHEYMKLPNRKMIRIRRTIYEDPGNPFQDELDEERAAAGMNGADHDKAGPEDANEVSPTGRSFFELDVSRDPFHGASGWEKPTGRSLSLDKLSPAEPSEVSPTLKILSLRGRRRWRRGWAEWTEGSLSAIQFKRGATPTADCMPENGRRDIAEAPQTSPLDIFGFAI